MASSPHLERAKSTSSASRCSRNSLAVHASHGDLSPPFSSRRGSMPCFSPLASSSHREQKQVCLTSAERAFKLLRNRTTRESSMPAMAACCTGMYSGGESPEGGDNADGTASCKPSPWKIFLRKLKAETKKITFSKPSRPGFHYDALSYAMNFDDGACQYPARSPVYNPD